MSRQLIAMIFCIIFFGLLIGVYGKFVIMDEVREDVRYVNQCLDFAALSAAETLREGYGSDDAMSLVCEDFFKAYELQADGDVSDIYLYIPAFVFCDTQGFRVGSLNRLSSAYDWSAEKPYMISNENFSIRFYLDDTFRVESGIYSAVCNYTSFFSEDGRELRDYEVAENRTAKEIFDSYSFKFSKENFYELKSDAIILSLQEAVDECINNHNAFTKELGIKYIYTTPSFYTVNQEYPSFVVCFQGYPLFGNGRFYSNLYVRSGYIGKKD